MKKVDVPVTVTFTFEVPDDFEEKRLIDLAMEAIEYPAADGIHEAAQDVIHDQYPDGEVVYDDYKVTRPG